MTAGPVAVRPAGRLRLIPAAKAVLTGIRDARKNREAGQDGPLGGDGGGNHGPFGKKNFNIPNGPWCYGLSRCGL